METDPENKQTPKHTTATEFHQKFFEYIVLRSMVWFNLNKAKVNLVLHVLSLLNDMYMCMYLHISYK